ncbi:MAG: hypothetical protein ABIT09_05800 [Croceibacterium sp.]
MPLKRMGFWREVSPKGAIGDLVHEWQKPNPYRWRILGVSVAATFAMIVLFVPTKSERADPRPPKITYITTFDPKRSDAQIVASNKANQVKQLKLQAELAAAEERRKQFFRTLGRASGLDVDALEKQYADDPKPPPAPLRTPGER